MKINKGYTLSQFVDIAAYEIADIVAARFDVVIKYNNFLKQPLKKEMFVSSIPNPTSADLEKYGENADTFIKANIISEKKVIFKGWNKMKYKGYYLQLGATGNNILSFETNNSMTYISEPKTIGDLFQATNGELELKNVDI